MSWLEYSGTTDSQYVRSHQCICLAEHSIMAFGRTLHMVGVEQEATCLIASLLWFRTTHGLWRT